MHNRSAAALVLQPLQHTVSPSLSSLRRHEDPNLRDLGLVYKQAPGEQISRKRHCNFMTGPVGRSGDMRASPGQMSGLGSGWSRLWMWRHPFHSEVGAPPRRLCHQRGAAVLPPRFRVSQGVPEAAAVLRIIPPKTTGKLDSQQHCVFD